MRRPDRRAMFQTERDRGLAIPLTALTITVLVLAVALAIDIGRASANVRELQKTSDSVAMDLARQIDGRTKTEIASDPRFQTTLVQSSAANGFAVGTPVNTGSVVTATSGARVISAELGEMVQGPDFDLIFSSINSGDVPDAVKVTTTDTTDYFFNPGSQTDSRSGVATRNPQVWLKVGSLAAGVNNNTPSTLSANAYISALNGMLVAQFGVSTSVPPANAGLDLVGYQGLAAAEVTLSQVAAAAGFASTNEMLESNMTAGQFFDATATALQNQGDSNSSEAATQMNNFRGSFDFDSDAQFSFDDTFQVNDDGAVVDSSFNVLDLIGGAGQAVNGNNLLEYGIDLGIPNVVVTKFQTANIEKEQTVYGPRGSTARTQQVRFAIELTLAPGSVAGILSPIRIPLVIEAAQATGTTTTMSCFTPLVDSQSTADVVTSALDVHFGTTPDLTAPGASFVVDAGVALDAGLISTALGFFLNLGVPPITGDLTVSGTTSLGGGSSSHTFRPFDDTDPSQRSTGGVDTDVGTQIGSNLLTGQGAAITNGLKNEIQDTILDPLSTQLINPLLQLAGISVGGADVHQYEDDVADDCALPALVE